MLNFKAWFSSSVRSPVETPATNASATPRSPSPQISAPVDRMSISTSSTLQHAHEPAARATPRPPSPPLLAHFDDTSSSPLPQHSPEPTNRTSFSSQPPAPLTNDARGNGRSAAATATVSSSSPDALAEILQNCNLSSSSQSPDPAAPPSVTSSPQQPPEDPAATTDHDASRRARRRPRVRGCKVLPTASGLVGFRFDPIRERQGKTRMRMPSGKVTKPKKKKLSTAELAQRVRAKRKEMEELAYTMETLKDSCNWDSESDVSKGSFRKPKAKKGVRFSNDDDGSHPRIPTGNWYSEVPSVPRRFPPPGTPYPSTMALPDEVVSDRGMVPMRPNTPPPTETDGLGLIGMTVVQRLSAKNIHIPAEEVSPANDYPITPEMRAAAADFLHVSFPEMRSTAGCTASPTYLTPERPTPGLYADTHGSISPIESPLPKTPVDPPDSHAAIRSPKPPGYEEIFGRSDDEDSDDLAPTPRRSSRNTGTKQDAQAAESQRLPTPPSVEAPTVAESMVSDIPAQSPSDPSRPVPVIAPQREMSWTTLPISSLPVAPQPFQVQPASAFTQPSVTWGQNTGYQVPPPSWSQTAFSAPPSTSTWMVLPAPTPPSFPLQSSGAFYQPFAGLPPSSFVHHGPSSHPEVDMDMDVDPFLDVATPRPRRFRHRAGRDYRRMASQLQRVATDIPGLKLRKGLSRRLLQHLFVIRQRPIVFNAFQGDRALRKGLAVQRRNRHALRSARRSVRPALRRLGRAARRARNAQQSAPGLGQRTMSIEMDIEEPSRTSVHCVDVDVNMDGGEPPAMSATIELNATMMRQPAVSGPPPAPLVRSTSDGAMPVDVSVPTIVVTPGTPLPEARPRENLRPAPVPSSSLLSASFVPRPIMTVTSEKPKSRAASPLRQESSLAEFEVPLVEASSPPPECDSKPELAAVVYPGPPVVVEPTSAAVPEAVVETQSPVIEATTPVSETRPPIEDAGYETDDETEWEPVPVPSLSTIVPATPTCVEPAFVEENAPATESAVLEEESSVEARPPVDVPAPHVATEGPQIIFHSSTHNAEDDDTVSLGCSEEDDEYYQDDENYQDGESYQDDGTGEQQNEEADEHDGTSEEEDYEENEEDSTEDQEGEEEEESNEYDESPPSYAVVKGSTSSASAPTSAPVSSPTAGPVPVTVSSSLPTPIHPPNSDAPSPIAVIPTNPSGKPYMGTVGEGFSWEVEFKKSTHPLFKAANFCSGNPLSGEAALRERKEVRNTVPLLVPPGTTAPRMYGEGPIVADRDAPGVQSSDQNRRMPGQPSKDVLTSADEDWENAVPHLNKGKGKATDLDAHLQNPDVMFDADSEEIIRPMDLTDEERQLNVMAFPKEDSNGKAPPSPQCYCRDRENCPSRGHTLTCPYANGVSMTPVFVPKPSSRLAIGNPVRLSPTPAFSAPANHQDSESPVLDAHPINEGFPSMPKTHVNSTSVDQGDLKLTPPSIGVPTAASPGVHEQPPPSYEFFEDAGQAVTGIPTAGDDSCSILFDFNAFTTEHHAEETSVFAQDYSFQTLSASTFPPAPVDTSFLDVNTEAQGAFDTTAAGSPWVHDNAATNHGVYASPVEIPSAISLDSPLDPDLPHYEQHLNWSSISDQQDAFDIGEVVPEDAAVAVPDTSSIDDSVLALVLPVQECDNVTSSTEEREEEREVETEIPYPLAAPFNDEQRDDLSEVFASVDEQQQVESQVEPDVPVLVASPSGVKPIAESSLQDVGFVVSQPPSEPSLPSPRVPEPLVELARTRVPTPPPPVHREEIIPPVAEEPREEPVHVEGTSSPVNEEAVKAATPSSGVPTPPSTPLVRRRSGGPYDRIACPHEKRTYFGRNPSSAQWNAFLQAGSPKGDRVLSSNVNKSPSLSPSTSPIPRSAVHPCASNELSTRSTPLDTTAIPEPARPPLPSRGRPRRRPTIPAAGDHSHPERDVSRKATQMPTPAATIKKCKSRCERKRKEETRVSSSSTPTASQPPCLPPSDSLSQSPAPSVPSWAKRPCCPNFSWTGQKPCIHALRASGHLVGTRWESESSESELEEEKDVPPPEQGWSAGYFAKLSLAAGAFYLLERIVF